MTVERGLSPSRQEREVRRSLSGRAKHTKDRVVNTYGYLRTIGFSHPDLFENVVDLSRTHGPARAERFMKGIEDTWQKQREDFDFGEYVRLFRMAHIRFGGGVADYFIRGLKHVTEVERSFQEYFDAVDKAVEVGGKKFARYYSSSLPWVWGRGGDAAQYRSGAMWVWGQTTEFRMATSFLWCMPETLEVAKMSSEKFSQVCVDMHKKLGGYAAFWAIRGLPGAIVYGMEPEQFIDDVKDVLKSRGQNAAGRYASGFQGICRLGQLRIEELKRWDREIAEFNPQEYYWGGTTPAERLVQKKTFRAYAQADIDALRALPYKENYLDLLDSLGQGAASLYARIINLAGTIDGKKSSWGTPTKQEIANIAALPGELKETALLLTKKDFGALVWFGFKIPGTIEDAMQYLKDARIIYEIFGRGYLDPQLRYSLNSQRHGKRNEDGIIYPNKREDTEWWYGKLLMGQDNDEEGWKQLLEQTDFEESDDF